MGIEMTDAIARFFVFLGSDPERAAQEAKVFNNVNGWVAKQKNHVAWMGTAAMLIPFFHIPLMIVDAWYLCRKMSYVCWGIAAIHGCKPSGTADFKVILAHWSGAIGDEMLDAAIVDSTNELNESALISSIADQVFKLLIRRHASRSVVVPVSITASSKSAAVFSQATAKFAAKISLKFFAKIGVKLLAKVFTGFVPLIGVIVAVSLNRYFVGSIAKSADRYYSTLQKYMEQNS